jgi:hypothetical protein
VAFLSTRGDWRNTSSQVSLGRARADYYLRWPLLIIGLAGLLVMLALVTLVGTDNLPVIQWSL